VLGRSSYSLLFYCTKFQLASIVLLVCRLCKDGTLLTLFIVVKLYCLWKVCLASIFRID